MISDDELMAGLKFLSRHAPHEYHTSLEQAIVACFAIRDLGALDKLRARPVDDLELSVRSLNALMHMGLVTIGDVETLMAKDDDVILTRGKRHYFSKKCLKEVRLLLKSIDLEVKREP